MIEQHLPEHKPDTLRDQDLQMPLWKKIVLGVGGIAALVTLAGSCNKVAGYCARQNQAFRSQLESSRMIPHYVKPGETIYGYGVNERISRVWPFDNLDEYVRFVEEKNPEHAKTLLAGEIIDLPDVDGSGIVGMSDK